MAAKIYKECLSQKGWDVLRKIKDIVNRYDAILAGGTALALRLGHRISYDLDFFTRKDIGIESIISAVRKTGLPFQVVSESEGTLLLEVAGVKISFFKYEYDFLERPLEYGGIKIAGVLDIAAMKVIAINQRGAKRDFVDLHAVLQDVPFHQIAGHMIRRFGKERINPVYIGKSLVYFKDADSDPEPSYTEGKELKWDSIRKFFKSHVRQFVLDLDVELAGK